MKKVSFIASTLLTSTMLLTTTQSVEAHTADLVTKKTLNKLLQMHYLIVEVIQIYNDLVVLLTKAHTLKL